MSYTLEQAQTELAYWEDLQKAAAKSQSYSFETGGFRRQKSMAELDKISAQVTYWRLMVDSLSRGGMRVRRVVPV